MSECRGAGLFGNLGIIAAMELVAGQPLIMERQDGNPKDRNAIALYTMYHEPVGYVAREHARLLSPQLDAGHLWLCKVVKPRVRGVWARILLWRDEGVTDEVSRKKRSRPRARTREDA